MISDYVLKMQELEREKAEILKAMLSTLKESKVTGHSEGCLGLQVTSYTSGLMALQYCPTCQRRIR